MELTQVVEAIVERLESLTQTRRTRKSNESSDKQSDVYRFPNADKSKWYRYKQFSTTVRFDCDKISDLEASAALTLLVGALADQVIIGKQKLDRMLSADKIQALLTDPEGVTVDVFDALEKKVGQPVSTDALLKQSRKLSPDKKKAFIAQAMLEAGLTADDLK